VLYDKCKIWILADDVEEIWSGHVTFSSEEQPHVALVSLSIKGEIQYTGADAPCPVLGKKRKRRFALRNSLAAPSGRIWKLPQLSGKVRRNVNIVDIVNRHFDQTKLTAIPCKSHKYFLLYKLIASSQLTSWWSASQFDDQPVSCWSSTCQLWACDEFVKHWIQHVII